LSVDTECARGQGEKLLITESRQTIST